MLCLEFHTCKWRCFIKSIYVAVWHRYMLLFMPAILWKYLKILDSCIRNVARSRLIKWLTMETYNVFKDVFHGQVLARLHDVSIISQMNHTSSSHANELLVSHLISVRLHDVPPRTHLLLVTSRGFPLVISIRDSGHAQTIIESTRVRCENTGGERLDPLHVCRDTGAV